MKKILITGFEPFASNQVNPSALWVDRIMNKQFSDRIVKSAVLPVTFQESFAHFQNQYDSFGPDIVLLTGLAQNRKSLSVERIGINWMDACIPDNKGFQPRSQKIREQGPDGLFTTVSMEKLCTLCSGLSISTSAGEYVCNYLLYEVLHYINRQGHQCQATFFHLPGVDEYETVYKDLDRVLENI